MAETEPTTTETKEVDAAFKEDEGLLYLNERKFEPVDLKNIKTDLILEECDEFAYTPRSQPLYRIL